jgi:type I restriction enzyme S subunit
MMDWKIYQLGELTEILSGKRIFASDYVQDGVLFYRSKEIIQKALGQKISNPLFIKQERFDEIKNKFGSPVDGDLLISAVGERAGIPYFLRNEVDFYFKDGNLIWFRNFTQLLDSEYLCYFFKSRIGQHMLESQMIGSAQKALTISGLKEMSLNLPPLPEQKAIANVLIAFDDKIELLQQQNQTLETIAQTIFKQWFGKYQLDDELPEGWRVGKLEEISNLKSGYAFKSNDFVELNSKKALKIKDLKGNGRVELSDISSVSDEVTKISRVKYFRLEAGDIVLAMSGNTTGKIGIVPPHSNEVYLNQRVGKFFMKDEKLNSFLYSFLMSGNYEDKILSMGYGSAQPNISPTQIENIDIVYPTKEMIIKFSNLANPIFQKVLDNNAQIQSLTKTRDTLLPKLMSGLVRVKM